jgi:hypothetical protein
MHGLDDDKKNVPDDCRESNKAGLIARGDKKVGELVAQIQASPVWNGPRHVAIVITWDEGDHDTRRVAQKIRGNHSLRKQNPRQRASYWLG